MGIVATKAKGGEYVVEEVSVVDRLVAKAKPIQSTTQ